jgi:DMSO/TMAO reductase YedYZ molybdopterin-dependent catalytic subunit
MVQDPDKEKYQTGQPRHPDMIAGDVIISPDTRRPVRLPPGQTRTRKWPTLQAGTVPLVGRDQWQLDVFGSVERTLRYHWHAFQALPRVKVYGDLHCVTRWSRLDNLWEGVSTRQLLQPAGVRPEARYVVLHAYDDNWTTNLPLEDFLAEDALLADTHDGAPLSAEHGGPVRAMIPRLYAWKSAKWVRALELLPADRPGYWERAGYHNHGNPWSEERFGP